MSLEPTCSFVGVDAGELDGSIMTFLRVFFVLLGDAVRCVPVSQSVINQVNLQDSTLSFTHLIDPGVQSDVK